MSDAKAERRAQLAAQYRAALKALDEMPRDNPHPMPGTIETIGNLIGLIILIGVPVYALMQLHAGLHGMADGLHMMAGALR